MSRSGPEAPVVSVIVLSWNTKDLTLACLAALAAETPRHAREVLVLDNASGDGSADAIADRFPALPLQREETNLGYAAGNNARARDARGRYLCLLGSDTAVEPGAIDALVDFLEESPDYAAAAPQLVGPDGGVQRACMRWPTIGVALVYDMCYRRLPLLRRMEDRYYCRDFDHRTDADVEQPPGTCFVVRRADWDELGGMDEELWLFFNDVDLCRRLYDRDRKIRFLAGARVMHHEGQSTKAFRDMIKVWAKDRLAYYRKHHGRLGEWVVRGMIRLRAMQEWWVLGRRHADPQHRRNARRELRAVVREVLAR